MLVSLQREEDFFSFLQSNRDKLVLVKFSTTWCAPCQELQKSLQELLQEKNDLLVLEVDAERFPHLAQKFAVYSVPTVFLFRQGENIKKGSGKMSVDQLKEFLREQ
jgi:thioredoxin 1